MKYWPVSLFLEVAESLIGRALLFAICVSIGSSIGCSIAVKELVLTYNIFGYVMLAAWSFTSLLCAVLGITLFACLLIYIRFETKHWFLIPITLLSALHAYFTYQLLQN